MEEIKKQIRESVEIKQLLLNNEIVLSCIQDAAEMCIESLRKGNKIMLAGNGGSAADAQHIAGELVNRFGFDRPAIAALAISTDTSVTTSIANDSSYNFIFSRQVEAIGIKGDVLITLSTSGNSTNILEAIKSAAKKGIATIGFSGSKGGKMSELCNIIVKVPSESTPRIQEVHILIGHILCHIIETSLYSAKQ